MPAPCIASDFVSPDEKCSRCTAQDTKMEDVTDKGHENPNNLEGVDVELDLSETEEKAYIGGYRNKSTGVTYHHCTTQTDISCGPDDVHLSPTLYLLPTRSFAQHTDCAQPSAEGTERGAEAGHDFRQLRREVQAWHTQEAAQIKEAHWDPEQQRELLLRVLEKETQLLAALDRLSSRVHSDAREKAVAESLMARAQPRQMTLTSGESVALYMPQTLRAVEDLSMYQRLKVEASSVAERTAVLSAVEQQVQSLSGSKKETLLGLIRRERDLMAR